ncbi:unannotated protein [freshwater metagenome]|uniref:Unannotated protein n=1 Tax=freshwater metagenome TaxID=449393 RepID=A0A6J6LB08_9ZZZZ|nr:hypothetical protein [Actinomycetota bacterium]
MGHLLLPELAGTHSSGIETGAQFAQRVSARAEAGFGPVPVAPALASLLPSSGLERGGVYACAGDAPMSLLFSLVATATSVGSWLACVDVPRVGLMAAHEYGVALQRVMCVSTGGHTQSYAQVVGALVDGIDLVVLSSPACSAAEARRIVARAKASGSVLLILGRAGQFSPDVVLSSSTTEWHFHTHASSRTMSVQAHGRRVYNQRALTVQLPAADGAASL